MKKINGRYHHVNQGFAHGKTKKNFFFINPSSFYFLLIMKRHQNTPSGSFWWRFAFLAGAVGACLFFVIDLAQALGVLFQKRRIDHLQQIFFVVGDGAGMAQRQDDFVGGDAVHA